MLHKLEYKHTKSLGSLKLAILLLEAVSHANYAFYFLINSENNYKIHKHVEKKQQQRMQGSS